MQSLLLMHNRQRLLLFLVTSMTVIDSPAEPASKTNKIYLVSKIVGKDFLSETIRIGDLNGDGAPDILFVQDPTI